MNEFHEEDEEYFCRFTFGQFISLALLEVVALFFVFYLGARYGPAMLGHEQDPITDHLSAAEEELLKQPSRAPKDIKYTFPEQLTQPERPIANRQPAVVTPRPVNPVVTPKPPVTQRQGGNGYSIQVGSYRQAGGAAAKVNQWQSKGYDAFLSIGQVANSGTWYRVRIGNFKSRDGARRFLDQLSKREKVSAIIVRSKS